MDSKSLINIIKSNFINSGGLLSASYPPTQEHLLEHLDDYTPFLLYYGENDFVKAQILRASEFLNDYCLVESRSGRIVSYANNEFIGAIGHYYQKQAEPFVKQILDKAVKSAISLLTYNDVLISYYNIRKNEKVPISSPLSGSLIEVFIELSDVYHNAGKIAYKSLDYWIATSGFKRFGLFLSKNHLRSKKWNELFERLRIPLHLKIQNRLCWLFYWSGAWSNFVYQLPIGPKVQTAKDNSNMVFALIAAFRRTHADKYKNTIHKWIVSFEKTMIMDGRVYRFWQLTGNPRIIDLGFIFPVLDILCDTYAFVEKKEFYLELAELVMKTCLNEFQWKIGLFPKTPGGKFNHIDTQTDFFVSLRRLYELTGNNVYKQKSTELFERIIKYHSMENGFVSSVNNNGEKVTNLIEPKYNALLLKAFILNEYEEYEIYGSSENHSLMKDR